MSQRAFQFALGASLEKASADLRAREMAHAGAVKLWREEEGRLRVCRAALEVTKAKIATAREELASPRAGPVDRDELARVHRFLTGLHAVAAREADQVMAAGKRTELASERVRLRRREVEAAFNQARALERMRTAREAEHRVVARRAAERAE